MKREADKNRVKRAIEHLEAAITNLDSIKEGNITGEESCRIFDMKLYILGAKETANGIVKGGEQ